MTTNAASGHGGAPRHAIHVATPAANDAAQPTSTHAQLPTRRAHAHSPSWSVAATAQNPSSEVAAAASTVAILLRRRRGRGGYGSRGSSTSQAWGARSISTT